MPQFYVKIFEVIFRLKFYLLESVFVDMTISFNFALGDAIHSLTEEIMFPPLLHSSIK